MYHLLTGLYSHWSQKPQFNVLLLGTSGSGKTAWLDKVRGSMTKTGTRNLSRITPTVGQNVVDLTLSSARLHFWDLGGDVALRKMWERYLDEADALVWAMDARDWAAAADVPPPTQEEREEQDAGDVRDEAQAARRRNESWGVLADLRRNEHLASLPLLIVMTQVDRLTTSQATHFRNGIVLALERKLAELRSTTEFRSSNEAAVNLSAPSAWKEWHVIVCSAKTGEGASEFVDWLHACARRRPIASQQQGAASTEPR